MTGEPLEIFREQSSLRDRVLPGYRWRPEQETLARAVLDCLTGSKFLIAEAGTGTGKSLAYLIPAIWFAREKGLRICISTETRALQKQIQENEIRIVEKVIGSRIRDEVCFGSSNYLCIRNVEQSRIEHLLDEDTAKRLMEWGELTADGLIQNTGLSNLNQEAKMKIGRNPGDCGASRCSFYDDCTYYRIREKWKEADLLVVNHNLLSSHFAFDQKILPEFEHVIIDEAHSFAGIFGDTCRGEFSFDEAFLLLKSRDLESESIRKHLQSFEAYLGNHFSLQPGSQQRIHEGLSGDSLKLLLFELDKEVARLKEKIEQERSYSQQDSDAGSLTRVEAMVQQLDSDRKVLESIQNGPGDKSVHWIRLEKSENLSGNYRIFVRPILTGPILRSKVLEKLQSVIFTSATLSSGGKDPFHFIRKELGFVFSESGGDAKENFDQPDQSLEPSRLVLLKLDSPFDYENKTALFLPAISADPAKEEERFQELSAKWILALVKLTGGGAFVLFTSNRALEKTFNMVKELRPEVAHRIIKQTSYGHVQALEKFRNEQDGILFGVSTFWQGVDIRGDALRLVIIVRLPFQVPDDPVLEAKSEWEKNEGQNPFRSLQLPFAVLSMKQGFGRLIRSEVDRGIVAILDPRILSKPYGKTILSALPRSPIVRKFSILEDIWSRWKKGEHRGT